MPVVPGKNDTGTKTAISTSDVAMTALVTSPMASRCGLVRIGVLQRDVPLHVFDDHDGVVDHQAGRQRDAEERERVD